MKNPRVPLSKSSKIPKRTRLQYRASVFGDQRTMRRVKGIRKGFVKKIGKRMTKISLLRKVAAVKAKARRQFTRNPERKTLRAKSIRDPHVYGLKHHVCVEADGKTIAQMKDTPEMRTLAKRFAKTYKRKHPAAVVTVVAY